MGGTNLHALCHIYIQLKEGRVIVRAYITRTWKYSTQKVNKGLRKGEKIDFNRGQSGTNSTIVIEHAWLGGHHSITRGRGWSF